MPNLAVQGGIVDVAGLVDRTHGPGDGGGGDGGIADGEQGWPGSTNNEAVGSGGVGGGTDGVEVRHEVLTGGFDNGITFHGGPKCFDVLAVERVDQAGDGSGLFDHGAEGDSLWENGAGVGSFNDNLGGDEGEVQISGNGDTDEGIGAGGGKEGDATE